VQFKAAPLSSASKLRRSLACTNSIENMMGTVRIALQGKAKTFGKRSRQMIREESTV